MSEVCLTEATEQQRGKEKRRMRRKKLGTRQNKNLKTAQEQEQQQQQQQQQQQTIIFERSELFRQRIDQRRLLGNLGTQVLHIRRRTRS
jgi:hypothetical protein